MKKYSNLKKLIWVITILWMCTIFYFSHQPADVSRLESGNLLVKMQLVDESELDKTVDTGRTFWLQVYIRKSAHAVIYFMLGILLTFSFADMNIKGFQPYIKAFLTGVTYAVSDELHQVFIPGRGPSFKDVMLDSAGIIAAVVLCIAVIEFCRYKKYKFIYYL